MGEIADGFESAFRAYNTNGVPSSGARKPVKSEIRALGELIEMGGSVRYATASPFNAVGDDSTDNTDALNAWLSYAGTDILELPEGIYRISEALDPVVADNIVIRGSGVIKYVGASTTPGDLLTFGEVGTPIYDLDIRGIKIKSATTLTAGHAIKLNELRDSHIDIKAIDTNLYNGVGIEESVKVWLHQTDIYCQHTTIETNDCIEIYGGTGYSQTVYGGSGIGWHIGGGCGGIYLEKRRTWGGNINVLISLNLVNTETLTGTTSTGAATITGLSSTANLVAGMTISGTGIVAGSYIVSVDSGTQVTMNQNGSANGSASLTFFNGNSQIFMGESVHDSSTGGAALYIDDDTIRPGGKTIDLGRCWLSSVVSGNAISLLNWGGEITGSPLSYGIVDGYFLNNTDTAQQNRFKFGAETNIGYNLYGMRSDVDITVCFDGVMHHISSTEYSETIALEDAAAIRWTETIADGANAAIRKDMNGAQWGGELFITNDTNGFNGHFSLGGGGVYEISDPATFYEVSTTPVDIGAYYAGGEYKIYNATGSTITLRCSLLKLRKNG